MRIRWNGPRVVRRVVGPHRWGVGAGWVHDVEAGLAAELLTEPGGAFAVDCSEPIVRLLGVEPAEAGLMTLAGVGGIADVAVLDKDGMRRVATTVWGGEDAREAVRRVRGLVKAAKAAIAAGLEVVDEGRDQGGADGGHDADGASDGKRPCGCRS